MKTLNLLLFIFLISVLGLPSCKKDVVDGNLQRKSFPDIDIIKIIPSSSNANVLFTISDVEPKDPIDTLRIISWPTSDPVEKDTIETNNSNINSLTIDSLSSDTEYGFRIEAITTVDDFNNVFPSADSIFRTSAITIKVQSLIVNEQNLKVTATAEIVGYSNLDASIKSKISDPRFEWTWDTINPINNMETTMAVDLGGGIFKAEFQFYDYSKDYFKVVALVDLDESPVQSNFPHSIFELNSNTLDGNLWVDMTELEAFENSTNTSMSNGINDLGIDMPIEGAVSFTLNRYAYVGLGRTKDSVYNQKFFRYDPRKNLWEYDPMDIPDFPIQERRMYAVSFKIGNDVYIGSGCRSCEEYDNYPGDTIPKQFSNIELLSDIWRLPEGGNQWIFVGDLDEGLFLGYGFESVNTGIIGGGLNKTKLEGDFNYNDMQGYIYEQGQIDPGEWHDKFPNNGIVDKKTFKPSIQILGDVNDYTVYEPEACLLLSNGSPKLFCTSCGMNGENVFYKITSPSSNQLHFDLVNDGIMGSGQYLDGNPLDGRLILPVRINNDSYTWEDIDDDGIMEITMNEVTPPPPATINLIELLKDGSTMDVIWKKESSSGLGNSIEVNINTGTIWCDDVILPDSKIDLSEIYTDPNPDELHYFEWIDEIPYGEYIEEITYELKPNPNIYSSSMNWNSISNANQKRYGTSVLEVGDSDFLIGGSTDFPITLSTQNDEKAFLYSMSNWMNPFDLGPFEKRIHPFSFVIGSKGYIGGGEKNNNILIPFDLYEYDPNDVDSNNMFFEKLAGCGIDDMTKGVGFSINGRGYILGESDGELQFWTYLPKK